MPRHAKRDAIDIDLDLEGTKAHAWAIVRTRTAPLADRVTAAEALVRCHYERSAYVPRRQGRYHPTWDTYVARYLANDHPSALFGAAVRTVLRARYPLDRHATGVVGDLRDGYSIWDAEAPARMPRAA